MHTRFAVGALALALAGSFGLTVPSEKVAIATVSVTLTDTVSSATIRAGDLVHAVLNGNVKAEDGRVILAAGSAVQLKLVAFQRPMPRRDDARMLFQLVGEGIEGQFGTASVKASPVGLKSGDPDREFRVKGGTKVQFSN